MEKGSIYCNGEEEGSVRIVFLFKGRERTKPIIECRRECREEFKGTLTKIFFECREISHRRVVGHAKETSNMQF